MTKMFFLKNLKLYKMSYFKIMFYIILLMSTMITINSSSWLNSWMGLEINLMAFIPLMMNYSKNFKMSNSMMMYFIIQVSSSSMMLTLVFLKNTEMNFFTNNLINNLIQFTILMKLGASPFHWWMPKIMINLNWMNSLIFITWQKIAPLFLLTMTNFSNVIYSAAIFSTIMGAILGINQSMLKMILIYSSINQLGWMLMIMFINFNLMILFLMIYSLINLMICFMLNYNNLNYMNQLFKINNSNNLTNKIITFSLFLSLAGLPPFLGFFTKFMSLYVMMKNYLILETFLLIIISTISLSFYMNPLMSMILFNKINSKWINKFNFNNKLIINIIFINMLISLIIFIPLMNQIL